MLIIKLKVHSCAHKFKHPEDVHHYLKKRWVISVVIDLKTAHINNDKNGFTWPRSLNKRRVFCHHIFQKMANISQIQLDIYLTDILNQQFN